MKENRKEELIKQISAYKERQNAEKKKTDAEIYEERESLLKALKARKGMIQDIIEVCNFCVNAGIKVSDFAPDSESLGFMQSDDKSIMIGFKGYGMEFMTNGDIILDYFLYEDTKQAEIKYIDKLLYQLPDFEHDFYEFVNSVTNPEVSTLEYIAKSLAVAFPRLADSGYLEIKDYSLPKCICNPGQYENNEDLPGVYTRSRMLSQEEHMNMYIAYSRERKTFAIIADGKGQVVFEISHCPKCGREL